MVPSSSSSTSKKDKKEYYTPLCRAIQMGDWHKAQQLLDDDKDALTDVLNYKGERTLHVAIGNPESIGFLDFLLDRIKLESLQTLVDENKRNGLHYAALINNAIAAKKLVEKNPHLLFVLDDRKYLPIRIAIANSHKATFLYLLDACKQHIGLSQKDGYHNPFEGENGVWLLSDTIDAGLLDVAYDLLRCYPELASLNVPNNMSPLCCIAKKWDAYPSAKTYNFYQRFVYSHVPTETYGIDDTYKIQDIENQKKYKANTLTKCGNSYLYPVTRRILAKFWKVALLHVPHIKHLYEDKVKHNTALMILKCICEEIMKVRSDHFRHYGDAFITAVENNTPEVIEYLSRFFPEAMWTVNPNNYGLAQLSIMNRCEHVYNFLVHEVTQEKFLHYIVVDNDDNYLLHLAGRLAPTSKLNTVTGAALQMQRELQWFQEVKKFTRSKEREAKNKKDQTPMMVFKKEHEDLRQKGEEWMKKTADSYTITTALIITIVFAAAITVPGGNNGESGKAIFETEPSFVIFAISDAISLFTSTTSLLLFLSILTARYAEEDFLYKLPKRLILGLVMLFISVSTMMIAFSATLYIMFGQERSWILIPIAALTCLPIASFVTLQLPLLVDLISSTYGKGIFGKRSELRITS